MSDKLSSSTNPKTYHASRRSGLTRQTSSDVSGGTRVHTQPTKIKATRAPSESVSPIVLSSDTSDFPLTQVTGSDTPDLEPPIGASFLSDPLSQIIPIVATSSSQIAMTTATITTTSLGAPISSLIGVPVTVAHSVAYAPSVPITCSLSVPTSTQTNLLIPCTTDPVESSDLSATIPECWLAPKLPISDIEYPLAFSKPLPDDNVDVIFGSSASHVGDSLHVLPALEDGPPVSNPGSQQVDPAMIVDDISQRQKRKTDNSSPSWADDWDSSSDCVSMADSVRTSHVPLPKLVQSPQPRRVRPTKKKRGSITSDTQGQSQSTVSVGTSHTPAAASSVKPKTPSTPATSALPTVNYGPSTSAGTSATNIPRQPTASQKPQQKNSAKLSSEPHLVVSSRKARLPPIVCSGELSPSALKDLKQITPLFESDFEARHANSRAIFYMRTPKDHKQMVSFLLNKGVALHSWTLPEDRNARVVIRGLHVDTPISDIEEALQEQDIQISNISRMRSRGQDPVEWPLFLVTLTGTSQLQTALKISHLGRIRVTVESFRGTLSVTQCYRCQEYGHTSHNCHERPVCVKCAGDHRSTECQKPDSEPLTCCHCRGPHPANFSLCPRRSKWIATRDSNRQTQQRAAESRIATSQPTPSVSSSASRVAGISYADRVASRQPTTTAVPPSSPRAGQPDESVASTVRDIIDLFKQLNICRWLQTIKDLLHNLSSARSGFEFCERLIPTLLTMFGSSSAESSDTVVHA